MPSEEHVVKHIIKRYGEVIDLRESPEVIIDIIRTFGTGGVEEAPDGGSLPGGAPPAPPPDAGTPTPPPGPTPPPPAPSAVAPDDPTIGEVMKELLALRRQVDRLTKQLAGEGG
jgi:hypothetical protein